METGAVAGAAAAVRRVPWHCKAVVFAATCILVGIVWDISWHETIGRDTFWTPAHLCMHLGGSVGGLVCGWLVLRTTFFGTAAERGASVGVWGFRGPLGAWVTIWGALALITSAPFDNWWHNAYGLDVKILSPPHSILAGGMFFLVLGGLLQVLSIQNRAADGGGKAGQWLFVFMGGILLCMSSIMIMERTFPNQQHAADFYRTTMLVFPFFLFMVAVPARIPMPATTVAALYMGIMGLAVWVLPLFPGEPKLGPITHPVTRMVPPTFPMLLVLPALAIDGAMLLFRRRSWWRYGVIGVVGATFFVAIFGVIQWHFSNFLLSHAAENWFFVGGRHWPYSSNPEWFHTFWRVDIDGLNARAMRGAWELALLSSGCGLLVGYWMSRVKR
ncbi:MAG: hypothetical protein QOF48_3923 [Verrucomicrobiota bacterium]